MGGSNLRVAITCALLAVGCQRLAADPFEGFYSGPPRPEDIEMMRKHQLLVQAYKEAKQECAKATKVTLVIPLTPAGDQLQFICVAPDDGAYKEQHSHDPAPPPPTNLDSRLAPLVWQNISVAVSRLGGPQGEPIVDGDVVYEWSESRAHTISGTVLWNEDVSEACTISLTTDRATRIVKSFKWTELRGGCQRFADKLDGPARP
jgi:hypothetical protein